MHHVSCPLERDIAGIDEEDRRQKQRRHQVKVELTTTQTALRNTERGKEGWQFELDSAATEAAESAKF